MLNLSATFTAIFKSRWLSPHSRRRFCLCLIVKMCTLGCVHASQKWQSFKSIDIFRRVWQVTIDRMTLGNVLSQMGIGTKLAAERFSEYHSSSPHDQHLYYAYEPHSHEHIFTPKHGHHGGKKGHAAMSALTLLAFLFFLHILQQCLREHMQSMANPQIMVMTAAREAEEKMANDAKIDKAGITEHEIKVENNVRKTGDLNKMEENHPMTKIITAQSPKIESQRYSHLYGDYMKGASNAGFSADDV